jgi:hypothetical protein
VDLARYATFISYRRFSSAQQASGTSEARQQGMADDWAASHNITLSPLSATDQGLSGYKGSNLEVGELGRLLAAVQAGAVPTPALLLLEAQDRFGRRPPVEALQTIFGSCLRHGLDLLLLDRNLLVTSDELNRDVSVLIRLALEIDAAHKHSERLSRRLLDAHQRGRDAIAEGKPVRLGWAPHWLTWTGTDWQLNDSASTIRRLLELAADHGSNITAATLNDEGHRTAKGRSWTTGTVEHIISSAAVAGGRPTRRRDADGVVWGYWPELVTREEWEALKLRRRRRDPKGNSIGDQRSLHFIGQGISHCICGGVMGQRVASFVDRNGEKQHRRYVRCRRCKVERGKADRCHQPAVQLTAITAHLLTRLSRNDLAQLFPQERQSQAAAMRSEIDAVAKRLEQQQAMAAAGEQQIARMLASDPDAVPIVARQVAAAEQQAKSLDIQLHGLRGELRALEATEQSSLSADLQGAVRGLLQTFATGADTAEQRRQVNLLLRRLGVRITVDANGERCGLQVGDSGIDWQPLRPALDLEGLRRGMTETINVDFYVDDEVLEKIKQLPGENGVKDLGVAIRHVLGGDGQALVQGY